MFFWDKGKHVDEFEEYSDDDEYSYDEYDNDLYSEIGDLKIQFIEIYDNNRLTFDFDADTAKISHYDAFYGRLPSR
jgi:hypothetical protein